jgi:DNA-binding NarL/FixJ family response regulator
MFTVAIVDDQPVARAGLVDVAISSAEFAVIACVDSMSDLDLLDRPPDVAVLRLEALAGAAALPAIEELSRRCPVVVNSAWARPLTVVSVLRAGAQACLTRFSDAATILSALSTVAHGGLYVCPDLVEQLQGEMASGSHADPTALAPREIETLTLIAIGLTHAQIARRMGLAPATVNTYAKRLRSKLKAGNKAELTRMAVELGHLDTNWSENRGA